MKRTGCDTMRKIIIKQMRPHRQKILTPDGEEMRLQQWANKKAASALKDAGGDPTGMQFTQARDKLMRDAVMHPENFDIKFFGERVPFEGQQIEGEMPMQEEMPTQEDMEAEHMRNIMTSHNTAFRDAWSILKS